MKRSSAPVKPHTVLRSARRFLAALLVVSMLLSLPVLASPGISLSVSYEEKAPSLQVNGLPASALADHFWQFSKTDRSITYRGGWSAGFLDSTGFHTFAYVNSSDRSWLMRNTVDQWQSPAGAVGSTSGLVSPHFADGYATGIGYRVPYAGTVGFSLDSASLEPGDGFAVFRNGEMVFPTAGASIGNAGSLADWHTITAATDHISLSREMEAFSCEVLTGDTISFVIKRGNAAVSDKSSYSPRVHYKAMAASMPTAEEASATLSDHYPTFMTLPSGERSLLAFRGRFAYAYADKGTCNFRPLGTEVKDGALYISESEADGYVLVDRRGREIAALAPSAKYDLAVTYTVRYSGTAELCLNAEGANGVRYACTVYRNGEPLAPTYYGNAAELAAKTLSVTLRGGDRLAFVLSADEGAEAPVPITVDPSVVYREITDTVAIGGAAMTLTESLDLHVYMVCAKAIPDADFGGVYLLKSAPQGTDMTDAVRLPLTESINNINRYTYTGLAAKEMTDTVYAVPYYTENGEEVLGAPFAFSIRDYVTALYGEDGRRNTVLTDMLAYGAAAQRYFSYRTDDLADSGLSEAQRSFASKSGLLYESDLKIGAEYERAPSKGRITGISLLLESRIAFRTYVAEAEGERDAIVQFSVSGSFTDAINCPVENGSAVMPGIPVAGVGRVYHMRLRTRSAEGGYLYGPVVRYSVKSYAANASVSASEEVRRVIPLSEAALLYGYSALSYANAKEAE